MDRGGDWWAQVSALTVAPESADPAAHPGDCQDLAGRLVELARALALLQEPAGVWPCGRCGPQPCLFAETPGGGEACALIPLLAVASVRPRRHRPLPRTPQALRRAYLQALLQAAAAVSHCRRTQHVTGSCWFAPVGYGQDVCGRILTVAHLLSEPAPRI